MNKRNAVTIPSSAGLSQREMTAAFFEQIDENRSRLVLFAGSGISKQQPSRVPVWRELAQNLLDTIETSPALASSFFPYARDLVSKDGLYRAIGILHDDLGDGPFMKLLDDNLTLPNKVNELHRLVARANLACVLTTNYDTLMEKAHRSIRNESPRSFAWDERDKIAEAISIFPKRFFIFHFHGVLRLKGGVTESSSLVLRDSQTSAILGRTDILQLLNMIFSDRQVIFAGYQYSDPDFQAIYKYLCMKQLRFRYPALLVTSEVLGSRERNRLSAVNIQIIPFIGATDDAALNEVLAGLLHETQHLSREQLEVYRENLEDSLPKSKFSLQQHHLFVSEIASDQVAQLTQFMQALILHCLNAANPPRKQSELEDKIKQVLTVFSPILEQALHDALSSLHQQNLVFVSPENEINLNRAKVDELRERIDTHVRSRRDGILKVAEAVALHYEVSLHPGDLDNLERLFLSLLQKTGRQLAETFVFRRMNRLSCDDIKQFVDEFCANLGMGDQTTRNCYLTTLETLLIHPTKEFQPILEKDLHAWLLTSVYLLDPVAMSVMQDFVEDHIAFFDSSVIIRALIPDLRTHALAKAVFDHTKKLRVLAVVTIGIFNEVVGHILDATKQFGYFEDPPDRFISNIEKYLDEQRGSEGGNLFVRGFYQRFRSRPDVRLDWRRYLTELTQWDPAEPQMSKPTLYRVLSQNFNLRIDETALPGFADIEIARLTKAIIDLRQNDRDPDRSEWLSRHEAIQFATIHHIRKHTGRDDRVWFITNDRYINRLQIQEYSHYALPIAYTPDAWLQYLGLIDYAARGTSRLGEILPASYYGLVLGSLDLNYLEKHFDRLTRTVPKEILQGQVQEYHVTRVAEAVRRATQTKPGED